MRHLFLTLNVVFMFALVGNVVFISGVILHMLYQTEEWDLIEYLALLHVSTILLIVIYGILTSYQDKIIAGRKARLELTDEKPTS